MAGGVAFALVLLLALIAPLALYYLVRAEHGERREMDRESAERAARRDTDTRDRER